MGPPLRAAGADGGGAFACCCRAELPGALGASGGRGPACQVQLQPWVSGARFPDVKEGVRCISDTMFGPGMWAAGGVGQGEILKQCPKFPPSKALGKLDLIPGGSKRGPPSPLGRSLGPGGVPLLLPLPLLLLRLPRWGLALRCGALRGCGCSCGCGDAPSALTAVVTAAAAAISTGADHPAGRVTTFLRQAYACQVAAR